MESSSNEPLPQRRVIKALRVPTNADERMHVTAVHGHGSKRQKILHFLHSKAVEYTLLGLLLLDLIVLFFELFLSAEYPPCPIILRQAVSCCPPEHDTNARWLAEEHSSSICQEPYIPLTDAQAGCDPHANEWLHHVHVAFFSITVAILSLFLIEHILLMICLGVKVFFQHVFYVVDLLVVSISFVLEIVFFSLQDELLSTVTGILVLVRVWRFIRVGHGVVEATVELAQSRFDKLVTYNERLEKLLTEHSIPIPNEWIEEIHQLKSMEH